MVMLVARSNAGLQLQAIIVYKTKKKGPVLVCRQSNFCKHNKKIRTLLLVELVELDLVLVLMKPVDTSNNSRTYTTPSI